tara:strand:- start:316 stop:486 length:171 start_codon:yes stop_codon:yes gene_type:complete
MMKKLGTGYLAFGAGVIFGAIIATLTSYYIFEAALGSPEAANILQIEDCLRERIYG